MIAVSLAFIYPKVMIVLAIVGFMVLAGVTFISRPRSPPEKIYFICFSFVLSAGLCILFARRIPAEVFDDLDNERLSNLIPRISSLVIFIAGDFISQCIQIKATKKMACPENQQSKLDFGRLGLAFTLSIFDMCFLTYFFRFVKEFFPATLMGTSLMIIFLAALVTPFYNSITCLMQFRRGCVVGEPLKSNAKQALHNLFGAGGILVISWCFWIFLNIFYLRFMPGDGGWAVIPMNVADFLWIIVCTTASFRVIDKTVSEGGKPVQKEVLSDNSIFDELRVEADEAVIQERRVGKSRKTFFREQALKGKVNCFAEALRSYVGSEEISWLTDEMIDLYEERLLPMITDEKSSLRVPKKSEILEAFFGYWDSDSFEAVNEIGLRKIDVLGQTIMVYKVGLNRFHSLCNGETLTDEVVKYYFGGLLLSAEVGVLGKGGNGRHRKVGDLFNNKEVPKDTDKRRKMRKERNRERRLAGLVKDDIDGNVNGNTIGPVINQKHKNGTVASVEVDEHGDVSGNKVESSKVQKRSLPSCLFAVVTGNRWPRLSKIAAVLEFGVWFVLALQGHLSWGFWVSYATVIICALMIGGLHLFIDCLVCKWTQKQGMLLSYDMPGFEKYLNYTFPLLLISFLQIIFHIFLHHIEASPFIAAIGLVYIFNDFAEIDNDKNPIWLVTLKRTASLNLNRAWCFFNTAVIYLMSLMLSKFRGNYEHTPFGRVKVIYRKKRRTEAGMIKVLICRNEKGCYVWGDAGLNSNDRRVFVWNNFIKMFVVDKFTSVFCGNDMPDIFYIYSHGHWNAMHYFKEGKVLCSYLMSREFPFLKFLISKTENTFLFGLVKRWINFCAMIKFSNFVVEHELRHKEGVLIGKQDDETLADLRAVAQGQAPFYALLNMLLCPDVNYMVMSFFGKELDHEFYLDDNNMVFDWVQGSGLLNLSREKLIVMARIVEKKVCKYYDNLEFSSDVGESVDRLLLKLRRNPKENDFLDGYSWWKDAQQAKDMFRCAWYSLSIECISSNIKISNTGMDAALAAYLKGNDWRKELYKYACLEKLESLGEVDLDDIENTGSGILGLEFSNREALADVLLLSEKEEDKRGRKDKKPNMIESVRRRDNSRKKLFFDLQAVRDFIKERARVEERNNTNLADGTRKSTAEVIRRHGDFVFDVFFGIWRLITAEDKKAIASLKVLTDEAYEKAYWGVYGNELARSLDEDAARKAALEAGIDAAAEVHEEVSLKLLEEELPFLVSELEWTKAGIFLVLSICQKQGVPIDDRSFNLTPEVIISAVKDYTGLTPLNLGDDFKDIVKHTLGVSLRDAVVEYKKIVSKLGLSQPELVYRYARLKMILEEKDITDEIRDLAMEKIKNIKKTPSTPQILGLESGGYSWIRLDHPDIFAAVNMTIRKLLVKVHIPYEDIVYYAQQGVLMVAKDYDPTTKMSLKNYLVNYGHLRAHDLLRKDGHSTRSEAKKKLKVAFNSEIVDNNLGFKAVEPVELGENKRILNAVLKELGYIKRDRDIFLKAVSNQRSQTELSFQWGLWLTQVTGIISLMKKSILMFSVPIELAMRGDLNISELRSMIRIQSKHIMFLLYRQQHRTFVNEEVKDDDLTESDQKILSAIYTLGEQQDEFSVNEIASEAVISNVTINKRRKVVPIIGALIAYFLPLTNTEKIRAVFDYYYHRGTILGSKRISVIAGIDLRTYFYQMTAHPELKKYIDARKKSSKERIAKAVRRLEKRGAARTKKAIAFEANLTEETVIVHWDEDLEQTLLWPSDRNILKAVDFLTCQRTSFIRKGRGILIGDIATQAKVDPATIVNRMKRNTAVRDAVQMALVMLPPITYYMQQVVVIVVDVRMKQGKDMDPKRVCLDASCCKNTVIKYVDANPEVKAAVRKYRREGVVTDLLTDSGRFVPQWVTFAMGHQRPELKSLSKSEKRERKERILNHYRLVEAVENCFVEALRSYAFDLGLTSGRIEKFESLLPSREPEFAFGQWRIIYSSQEIEKALYQTFHRYSAKLEAIVRTIKVVFVEDVNGRNIYHALHLGEKVKGVKGRQPQLKSVLYNSNVWFGASKKIIVSEGVNKLQSNDLLDTQIVEIIYDYVLQREDVVMHAYPSAGVRRELTGKGYVKWQDLPQPWMKLLWEKRLPQYQKYFSEMPTWTNIISLYVPLVKYKAKQKGYSDLVDYFRFLKSDTGEESKQECFRLAELMYFSFSDKEDSTYFFRTHHLYRRGLVKFLDETLYEKWKDSYYQLNIRVLGPSKGQELDTMMIYVYEALERLHARLLQEKIELEEFPKWVATWDLHVDLYDVSSLSLLRCRSGLYDIEEEGLNVKDFLLEYYHWLSGHTGFQSLRQEHIDEVNELYGAGYWGNAQKEIDQIKAKYVEVLHDGLWKIPSQIRSLFVISGHCCDFENPDHYALLRAESEHQKYDLTWGRNIIDRHLEIKSFPKLFKALFSSQRFNHLFVFSTYAVRTKSGRVVQPQWREDKVDLRIIQREDLGSHFTERQLLSLVQFFGREFVESIYPGDPVEVEQRLRKPIEKDGKDDVSYQAFVQRFIDRSDPWGVIDTEEGQTLAKRFNITTEMGRRFFEVYYIICKDKANRSVRITDSWKNARSCARDLLSWVRANEINSLPQDARALLRKSILEVVDIKTFKVLTEIGCYFKKDRKWLIKAVKTKRRCIGFKSCLDEVMRVNSENFTVPLIGLSGMFFFSLTCLTAIAYLDFKFERALESNEVFLVPLALTFFLWILFRFLKSHLGPWYRVRRDWLRAIVRTQRKLRGKTGAKEVLDKYLLPLCFLDYRHLLILFNFYDVPLNALSGILFNRVDLSIPDGHPLKTKMTELMDQALGWLERLSVIDTKNVTLSSEEVRQIYFDFALFMKDAVAQMRNTLPDIMEFIEEDFTGRNELLDLAEEFAEGVEVLLMPETKDMRIQDLLPKINRLVLGKLDEIAFGKNPIKYKVNIEMDSFAQLPIPKDQIVWLFMNALLLFKCCVLGKTIEANITVRRVIKDTRGWMIINITSSEVVDLNKGIKYLPDSQVCFPMVEKLAEKFGGSAEVKSNPEIGTKIIVKIMVSKIMVSEDSKQLGNNVLSGNSHMFLFIVGMIGLLNLGVVQAAVGFIAASVQDNVPEFFAMSWILGGFTVPFTSTILSDVRGAKRFKGRGRLMYFEDESRDILTRIFGGELDHRTEADWIADSKIGYLVEGSFVRLYYYDAFGSLQERVEGRSEMHASQLIGDSRLTARISNVPGEPVDIVERILRLDKVMKNLKDRGDDELIHLIEESMSKNPLISESVFQVNTANIGLVVRHIGGEQKVFVVAYDLEGFWESYSERGDELIDLIKNADPLDIPYERFEKSLPEIQSIVRSEIYYEDLCTLMGVEALRAEIDARTRKREKGMYGNGYCRNYRFQERVSTRYGFLKERSLKSRDMQRVLEDNNIDPIPDSNGKSSGGILEERSGFVLTVLMFVVCLISIIGFGAGVEIFKMVNCFR